MGKKRKSPGKLLRSAPTLAFLAGTSLLSPTSSNAEDSAPVQTPQASVTEPAHKEQSLPVRAGKKSSTRKKAAVAPQAEGQEDSPDESAMPLKSKFRYGNEELEVDPD